MCFNKEASRNSFIIGFGSSVILLLFGEQLILKLIGFAFIFISFMQLIDYMIWDDLDCKKGKNVLASKLGFLLIGIQPVLVLLALYIYDTPYKNIIISINLIYLFYLLYCYNDYLQEKNICSNIDNGRNKWNFINKLDKYYLNNAYILLFIFNVLMLIRHPYAILTTALVISTYVLTIFNYNYHTAEIWCYLANSVPLIILLVYKLKLL